MMKRLLTISGLALYLALALPAGADEITDTVEGALTSYKNGEYSAAMEDLSYALELIKQKKGENLKAYMPAPLAGWKADEAEAQTAGAAMMGGGTTVGRNYTKDDRSIRIEIVTDSPMMQTFAMMMSNPMFATSDGGKLIRIQRQKAIEKFNSADRSGEIRMMVANRYMITVSGNQIDEKDLLAYAKAIDLKKLTSLQ